MLEIILCSLFTILPDYLFRRYVQGKRFGREINFFSVWYELRWGITSCLILTIGLITLIFYFHPATTNVTALFRTVPILPETNGRVAEVFVSLTGDVKKGQPIFRLDDAKTRAALEVANRRVLEVEAAIAVAPTEIAAAEGQVQQAQGTLDQANDELKTKQELNRRQADIVARREIEKLQNAVAGRKGGLAAAMSAKQASEMKLTTLLPAEKASAEAARQQAQVELDKMIVRAGVDGRVEQFVLRVGDIVNPLMRPAGILIPTGAGQGALVAGFRQIEAQVMTVGMAAEVTCVSKPMTIIPMVVTGVQDYIAAGQFRTGEQLFDAQQVIRPGTITVFLEPMYEGGLDGVTPGSSCIANAYSSNHDKLQDANIGTATWIYLHGIDTVALVHALILRIQALLLPFQTLVFSGH